MKIKVLYFAQLREKRGLAEEQIQFPTDGSVKDLLGLLGEAHPQLCPFLDTVSVAVNRNVVEPTRKLMDGDEVALLPPVSGG